MPAIFNITREKDDAIVLIDRFVVDDEEGLLNAIEERAETTLIGTDLVPVNATAMTMILRLSLYAKALSEEGARP